MSAAQENTFLALTGLENKSFSLLWRGSRDGFDAETFHLLCDGKANTLTVIKNTNGFIFGGFTSVPWESSGNYKADNRAFLFTLTNPSDMPFKLRVCTPQKAVYHRSINGPTFGAGRDLIVFSLSNTNRKSFMNLHSYKFPNDYNDDISGTKGGKLIVGGSNENFQTVEIEVFQVA